MRSSFQNTPAQTDEASPRQWASYLPRMMAHFSPIPLGLFGRSYIWGSYSLENVAPLPSLKWELGLPGIPPKISWIPQLKLSKKRNQEISVPDQHWFGEGGYRQRTVLSPNVIKSELGYQHVNWGDRTHFNHWNAAWVISSGKCLEPAVFWISIFLILEYLHTHDEIQVYAWNSFMFHVYLIHIAQR